MKKLKDFIKNSLWKFTALFAMMFTIMAATGALTITDTGIDSGSTATNYDLGGGNISDVSEITINGYNSVAPFTEDLNFVQTIPEAKSGILWKSYDASVNDYVYSGWIVCHYNSSVNYDVHQHCSIETIDNSTGTPSLNSHFTINYGSNLTRAEIRFPQSDVKFISNQKLYFGDDKQVWIQHNATTGDLDFGSNNDLFMNTLDLDMNGRDIQNIGDIYSDTNSIDLKSANQIKLFPDGQTSIGWQVDIDGSALLINGLGTSDIKFNDDITVNTLTGAGNAYACLDSNGKLYRSAVACS